MTYNLERREYQANIPKSSCSVGITRALWDGGERLYGRLTLEEGMPASHILALVLRFDQRASPTI
jgi:hypothetical protein